MAAGVQKAWSTTAASNASADANINFAEGQTPASLNNSARAEMAAVKAFANQILGALTSGGSANAQTLTSDAPGAISTAYAAGMGFVFRAGYTNSGACTLNVDGVGAKSIKKGGALAALAANDIVAGGIYFVVYQATGDCFVLLNPESGQITSQPLDADLTAIAALGYTSGSYLIKKTAADTWSLVDEAGYGKLATAASWTALQTINVGTIGLRFNNNNFLFFGSSSARRFLIGTPGDGTFNGYVYNSSDVFERQVFGVTESTGVWNFNVDPTNQSAAIRTAGKTAVPIPASAMVPNTTNGPSAGVTETTTNKVMYRTLDFDATTQESAQFLIAMPKGWDEGTVTFQACWTAESGSGGVAFNCAGLACSDDDALDATFGTAQQVTDTLLAAGDVHWTAESSAITIAGSPAENDLVLFRVQRVPADASDTLAVDAQLITIRLFVTTNAKNDA